MSIRCTLTAVCCSIFILSSCTRPPAEGPAKDETAAPLPTDRIPLPPSVQQNLGITWGKARYGRLETVLTVPGEIVAVPERSWTLAAPLAGTVTRMAALWTSVAAGDLVAEIASPTLADWQTALFAARAEVEDATMALSRGQAELEPTERLTEALGVAAVEARSAVSRAESALERSRQVGAAAVTRLAEVTRLREADAVSAAELLAARRDALELDRVILDGEAALRALRVEAAERALGVATARADAAGATRRLALLAARVAAATAGLEQRLAALEALCGPPTDAKAISEPDVWTGLRALPLRARTAGIVVAVHASQGAWIETGEPLLTVVDGSVLRFTAMLPQGDLTRLPGTLALQLEVGGVAGLLATDGAALRPLADAASRSVILEAAVANPQHTLRVGMAALAHVSAGHAANLEVLVPDECVVRDGLESIVFRRDPQRPDQVIRTPVILGRASGGWIEVIAGVDSVDQLVLNGVHQLRTAGMGKGSVSGHFHSDGTFHEGDE